MELTESEKKGLRRFSLLLESLSDDPWELRIWFDDGENVEPLHYNKFFKNYKASGDVEIDFFMEALLNNILREIETNEMLYNHWSGADDYCRGYVVFEIDPKNKTFDLIFDYEVETVDYYGTSYNFTDFSDLNNEEIELIEKFKQEDTEHTVNFDGGGDSGYIEEKDNDTGKNVPPFIMDMLYDILNSDYGGWETNHGCNGYFEINYENEDIFCKINVYDTSFENTIIETLNFEDERN